MKKDTNRDKQDANRAKVSGEELNHSNFENLYWSYYIFLENSFLHATRYVYLSCDNFACYSYEFNSLLLTFATEVENVIKTIYRFFEINGKVKKGKPESLMQAYDEISHILFQNLTKGELPEVAVTGRSISLSPFDGFGKQSTWWSDHNAIKHDRQMNLQKANMKNVINALAGIYCLDSLFGIELEKKEPDTYDALLPLSNIFHNENFNFKYNFNPICTYNEIGNNGDITRVIK